ncbi:MAG: hypothetical protein GX986_12530 [Firmicutes bacterium]|nr:hypothetical protein [Bacillota bacterium]
MMENKIREQLMGPLLIKENRVRRKYKGGALIDRFRGSSEESDGFSPEDWVGSSTYAINKDPIPEEGISKIVLRGVGHEPGADLEMSMLDILGVPEYASALFGEGLQRGHTPGVLVKLLDSCTTLTLQTHPDTEFARKHLNGNHGKCESWIVLDGRRIDGEDPFVYFGFKDGVTRSMFYEAYRDQDVAAMKALLNRVYVKSGDVFYVEPNIIHAIGPGVFMLEVQEPSDYVFNFDRKGTYWNLTDREMHMGLGEAVALASVNFDLVGRELLDRNKSHVDLFTNREQAIPVLEGHMTEYFGLESITSAHILERSHKELRIGIVLQGCLEIELHGLALSLEKGDTYILPAPQSDGARCVYTATTDDNGFYSILEAFPS